MLGSMNILYDHQAFTGSLHGGVSRYFHQLMTKIENRDDASPRFSILFSNNEYLTSRQAFRYRFLAASPKANQAASLFNRWYSNYILSKADFDVFHPTYYHPYFIENIGQKPVVLTFHDTLSERFGHLYPALGQHLTEQKRLSLARADVVIAVSEATKQEIMACFGTEEKKIVVIHHGNSFTAEAISQLPDNLHLPARYVLYVGSRAFYKNFQTLWQAIAPLMKADPDLHLVCAGHGTFEPHEQQQFQDQQLQHRVHHQPIKDDYTLIELYQKATVFVFPSLMEGFGYPILEAMSCSCPVVATAGTSFEEIAGDAILYCDSKSVESIKNQLENTLYKSDNQEIRIKKGLERSQLFTNQKTADATMAVYQRIV
jgi:glycosyltransferase involved in cell wall biosynthesis